MPVEFGFQGTRVIERKHGRQSRKILRHSRTVGQTQRCDAGSCLHQKAIAVAVITAIEFDDPFPAGESARQPDGAHCRFGSRVD